MENYKELDRFIGNRSQKKIRYATWAIRHGDDISVRHHDTDILMFSKNGTVKINCEGWRSPTTKTRLNDHLPIPFGVYQEANVWYLHKGWKHDQRWVFADGMRILPDGTVHGAGDIDEIKELKKLNKAIGKYTQGYINALLAGKVPAPDKGDCWFCLFAQEDGTTWGEMSRGKRDGHHLVEHITQAYYVPSLLKRAMEVGGASKMAWWVLGDL